MRLQDITWTTKSGEDIKLSDMTHTHLDNAIRHQQKAYHKWEAECNAASSYSGGDEAMRQAEMSADYATTQMVKYAMNLKILRMEKNRRANLSSVDEAIEVMQVAQGEYYV